MFKVTVCGAAGGIGQPLSLLLKLNEDITDLALYDLVNAPGVAADLSHINTPSKVTSYLGADQLPGALMGANLVIIPAGVPRKPGMTRDDLFKINAGIIRDLATAAATHCPKAFMLIISNPVNSTVPIVAEVFASKGVYDPKRIFGITTLDVVRASRFVTDIKAGSVNPVTTRVPIVGGHSGPTIVPLLSQIQPHQSFTQEEIEALTKRIQYGGDEVVKAKDGAGSATLSMAQAGARFAKAVITAALHGATGIVEPTFVDLDADATNGAAIRAEIQGLQHFALPVELGKDGVERIHSIGSISDYEKQLLSGAVSELKGSIQKGVDFVRASL
ncbi:malate DEHYDROGENASE, NAD-dependent [Dimargaris verticillata]|uniref:Malate dehydrogenase n=1 Tax=Dimargaris verticillata TaxID=2761393 RepID=A0A9W8E7E6_9FUNG|nr:malate DEHYDROGENASE, NAD-dependent [Dimargaris verticillata]